MSRENVEAFRRGIEAFNQGDVDGLAATMAPEGRIVPLRAALEDTAYSGPDAAREFWEASMQAWSALRVDIADFRDLGDRVLALGTIRSTARGTQAAVEAQAAWIATFQNGRATEIRTYASQSEALEAVGLRD